MPDASIPPADEPASHPDDLDIEVSDMRGPGQSGRSSPGSDGATPWYRQRVQVPRPLVVATLVVMLGLILIVATPIGSALRALIPQPTPTTAIVQVVYPTAPPATATPSPYPSPTLIAPAVGPIPANCPPSTPLVDFSSGQTYPGVGGSDVWMVGFVERGGGPVSGQPATAQIVEPRQSDGNGFYTPNGWPIQIFVYIKANLTQTITVTGHDLHTGYSLWFSHDTSVSNIVHEAVPVVTIDASDNGVVGKTADGQWKIWFGVLYLPGAGCYALHANWPGGGWVANFAAGR